MEFMTTRGMIDKIAALEKENAELKKREEEFTWFEEATRDLTGQSSGDRSIRTFLSNAKVKFEGLTYKVSNLEAEINRLNTSYRTKSEELSKCRTFIYSATGHAINYNMSVAEWLEKELPKYVTKDHKLNQAMTELRNYVGTSMMSEAESLLFVITKVKNLEQTTKSISEECRELETELETAKETLRAVSRSISAYLSSGSGEDTPKDWDDDQNDYDYEEY